MDPQLPVGGRRSVTRIEVIDHLDGAFSSGAVTRAELVAAASRNGARSVVVELLGRLPDRKFSQPHDLWNDLADVPIEH